MSGSFIPDRKSGDTRDIIAPLDKLTSLVDDLREQIVILTHNCPAASFEGEANRVITEHQAKIDETLLLISDTAKTVSDNLKKSECQ